MRNITIGELAGFCGGVNLCVTTLENKLQDYGTLYCIGDVVHNKDVVNHFSEMGLVVVDDISEIPDNEISVIRAHGAEKSLYEEAERRNIKLIDLTCPKVLKIRDLIKENIDKDDTFIILFGEKTHPETKSTFSFCGILEYCDILNEKLIGCNVEVKNTICNATHSRQLEVEEMAKNNDCMIIIGGLKSSNSNKLNDVSKKYCKNTYFIENINDLDIDKVKNFENIGIMAGASTPKYIIDEVYDALC